jgi:ATPase
VPETLVPDTSVLVDGRITELLRSGEFAKARVLIARATLAELEAQANRHLETGVAGLDELANLQRMAQEGRIKVEFTGSRPSSADIELAKTGTIDALIRDTAVAEGGLYVTSDRVSAHAAAAQGIRHHYVRPIVKETPDLTHLRLWAFFDAETMSVHLKADCVPMVKRGQPGAVRYEPKGTKDLGHKELRDIVRECIEYTRRDYSSFTEMEKHGCTVLQLGPMRITIAQPPFSDGLELTAVRPITKKVLTDYELPDGIQERLEGKTRGIFIAGPPGSGKSTFAAAVAEHLHGLKRVVKTMEQPRDLQVSKEVTQYGALDRDMKWTGDVILLVRPDHVIYDEVRTTEDFVTFADMRLAGVGLIGVTHANRAIDAVQRLIGRVDLGMIPQIVDTILFIDAGVIASVLELEYGVKVPYGMTMEDLARPVVTVRDVLTGRTLYELYTFGEQIVVMPVEAAEAKRNPGDALMEKEVTRMLRKYVQGPLEVRVTGRRATIQVDESEVAPVIGKGGKTVQGLERKLGLHLTVQALPFNPKAWKQNQTNRDARQYQGSNLGGEGEAHGDSPGRRGAAGVARIRLKKTSTNIFILVDGGRAGNYEVLVEGEVIGEAVANKEGRLRFKMDTPEGQALVEAQKRGLEVSVQPL